MLNAKDAKRALKDIKAAGLNPAVYEVTGEAPGYWILKHRITGDIKTAPKGGA